MNYYGTFYKTALYPLLRRINGYLVRWLRKKYKRLRTFKKAHAAWQRVTAQYPRFFAQWQWVTGTGGKDEKSPVTRDCHAGILREPGGEIPPGHPTGVLRVGAAVSDKYTLIAAEYAANMAAPAADAPALTKMCLWIGVSKSGYYEWKDRPLSATAERQEYLKGKIEEIFDDNDAGSRRSKCNGE